MKKFSLPPLGMRIIKTAIAVYLCLLFYVCRGFHGMVVQSCIASIICIQPFMQDVKDVALNRIYGTLLGAFIGLTYLFLFEYFPILSSYIALTYFIISTGIIVSLYATVVLQISGASSLAAITYICITYNYPNISTPFLETMDRIVDTVIGIAVAWGVEMFRFPKKKHFEKIFFLEVNKLIPDRFTTIQPILLTYLKRLYEKGANICLVSRWAPAFLLSQMSLSKVNMPVIVMNGAALFDIENNEYKQIIDIPHLHADYLCNLMNSMGIGYCVYGIRENSMVIYRNGIVNEAEQKDYEVMKRSPYRNYLNGQYHPEDSITFIRTIDTDEKIKELEKIILNGIPSSVFRTEVRKQPRLEGYSGLYFFNANATIENMKNIIMEEYSDKKRVDVEIKKKKYDATKHAHLLLDIIQHQFETYF